MYNVYILGYPRHSTSTGVDNFFSLIFSYFCFLVAAYYKMMIITCPSTHVHVHMYMKHIYMYMYIMYLEALPRQATNIEIHQHIPQRL